MVLYHYKTIIISDKRKKMTRITKQNQKGRPRKTHKKLQYTLTMDPDLHMLLESIADKKQTSFSQLVTDIVLEFFQKSSIAPPEFPSKYPPLPQPRRKRKLVKLDSDAVKQAMSSSCS